MKEIFLGNKELFEETWIYDKWDWNETFPVIKISFASLDYKNQGLEKAIDFFLEEMAEKLNYRYRHNDYSGKFIELIEQLGKDNGVAILIDEYDKPIIDYIDEAHRKQAEENRAVLKNFYSGLKDLDKFIKILFITGVSKFSKVSLFSELNNLEDITISREYSQIVGYTKDEILNNYAPYIEKVQKTYQLDNDSFLKVMKLWYNGYSWDAEHFLYNPFSILNLFSSSSFDNYWFKSGTPTFLTKMIKEKRNIDISEYDSSFEIDSAALDSYEINNIDIKVLLFQTGYLTIKERIVDPTDLSSTFKLAYPNKEVRDSFYTHLISEFTGIDRTNFTGIIKKIRATLENKEIEKFIQTISTLFSEIPHQIFIEKLEGYYHTIIYLILRMLGIKISVEVSHSHGRLDAVVKTNDYIYVMEFKMTTAEEALAQIENKGYYKPYIADGREIILLGIAFDKEEKNISKWVAKKI